MLDRISLYPGRVTLTPVSGQANTYDMERADSPTQEGTPLNKANLLTDATAALYGLGTDAVPDDVLSVLSKGVLAQVMRKYTRQVGTNADREVGSTMTLNVGGVPYEFIVVQQGKPSSAYDDSCDGTWLLMKYCYTQLVYNTNSAEYYNSSIDAWLNDDFLNILDVKDTIKMAKIPYRLKSGSLISGANGLARKVFLPSYRELGGSTAYSDTGAMLEYFSGRNSDGNFSLRIAYDHEAGGAVEWFTRDPYGDDAALVYTITAAGGKSEVSPGTTHYIRPCIILPSDGEYIYYTDDAGNIYTEQEYEMTLTDVLGNLVSIPASQIKDNVRIATGSYTGTGTYGASNPCSLTFDRIPEILFVISYDYPTLLTIIPDAIVGTLLYTMNIYDTNVTRVLKQTVTVSGNTVNFYYSGGIAGAPEYQSNYLGTKYYYVALG